MLFSSSFIVVSNPTTSFRKQTIDIEQANIPNDGQQEHIWPMYKHDPQHTGRSPFDTSDNLGGERWKYYIDSGLTEPAVIDKDGILYVSSDVEEFHAIYPNGTRKWKQDLMGLSGYVPAISSDGTIYVGTGDRFHAFNPDGTIKWILNKDKRFSGHPVISPDGLIYVGTGDGYLYVLYPNGTIKWDYKIDSPVRAPALDNDGNVYFTSYNKKLYCLGSDGTFKWKFTALDIFYNGPVISEDGTIYIAPCTLWIQAVNPDGTEKWKTMLEHGGQNPAIAPDGTLIISGEAPFISALDPVDGSIIWSHQFQQKREHTTSSVIGSDGTIYFACSEYIYAYYLDGTMKWKTRLTSDLPYEGINTFSDPIIGQDGTVYLTTWVLGSDPQNILFGYLHAIGGPIDPNAPDAPEINGPISGKPLIKYEYIFKSNSPLDRDIYYYIDWGDGSFENWIGPYGSGEEVKVEHRWVWGGAYTIKARAKDTENLWGPWGEFEVEVTKSRNKATNNVLFYRFLEKFPLMVRFLNYFIK